MSVNVNSFALKILKNYLFYTHLLVLFFGVWIGWVLHG